MAKILRKFQKIFAVTNDGSQRFGNGVFGSGKAGTKIITNDVEELQELSAFNNGWEDAVLVNSAGQPTLPPLPEMQALDYICTYQIAYILQEGVAEYNVDTTYYTNSIVKAGGTFNLYGSITDNNTGNSVSDPTKWKYLVNLATAVMTANTSSVANELVLYDGTGGRDIKRASLTGLVKAVSGVASAAVQGVDYYAPGGTEVAIADGGTGQSTALAGFDALKQSATTSYAGVLQLGIKSDAEAASSTSLVLPISQIINHPGVAKALGFVNGTGSGSLSISNNFNLTSVTKNSTGDYTVVMATALSTPYLINVFASAIGANLDAITNIKVGTTPTGTAFTFEVRNASGVLFDSNQISIMVFGTRP